MKIVNVAFYIRKYFNPLLKFFNKKNRCKEEKSMLRTAFKEAENDPDSKEIMKDWVVLDAEDWEG